MHEEVDIEKEMTVESAQRRTGTYDLYGIVNHYGSIYGGHYTADIRDLTNKQEENWFECNDSHVEAIEDPVLQSPTAFMLFYWRRD